METPTAHFKGETVVWRGPWHMDIPLDFHIVLAPDSDPKLMKDAAMVISKFLSEEWVQEAEAVCTIEDDEEA